MLLTAKQFDLLAALMEQPNQVMSYDTVMQRVWGGQFRGESNVLAVTVSTVRKALEEGGEPRLIQTVRGVATSCANQRGRRQPRLEAGQPIPAASDEPVSIISERVLYF